MRHPDGRFFLIIVRRQPIVLVGNQFVEKIPCFIGDSPDFKILFRRKLGNAFVLWLADQIGNIGGKDPAYGEQQAVQPKFRSCSDRGDEKDNGQQSRSPHFIPEIG